MTAYLVTQSFIFVWGEYEPREGLRKGILSKHCFTKQNEDPPKKSMHKQIELFYFQLSCAEQAGS